MITYKKAGVSVSKGNTLVNRIKKFAPKIGGFSDGIRLPRGLKDPILVGCADGVGTKLAIAQKLNIHHTIGYDLVGMNLNDLICSGARPLFFLDYFACGTLNVKVAEKVVRGIARACREGQCQLLGGETAEMPGFYKPGEYDLAGFATGVVAKRNRVQPKRWVKPGDILIGLPSSGLHSNGYSLVRKVFSPREWKKWSRFLMAPTQLYVKEVLRALAKNNNGSQNNIHGLVHITGGGFTENIPRILPPNNRAVIIKGSWKIHSIFREIQKRSQLSDLEMFRTFNMGIGMILAVHPKSVKKVRRFFKKSFVVGLLEKGKRGVLYVPR